MRFREYVAAEDLTPMRNHLERVMIAILDDHDKDGPIVVHADVTVTNEMYDCAPCPIATGAQTIEIKLRRLPRPRRSFVRPSDSNTVALNAESLRLAENT